MNKDRVVFGVSCYDLAPTCSPHNGTRRSIETYVEIMRAQGYHIEFVLDRLPNDEEMKQITHLITAQWTTIDAYKQGLWWRHRGRVRICACVYGPAQIPPNQDGFPDVICLSNWYLRSLYKGSDDFPAGFSARIVRDPVDPEPYVAAVQALREKKDPQVKYDHFITLIGNSGHIKGHDRFANIARALPGLQFRLVCTKLDLTDLVLPPNLQLQPSPGGLEDGLARIMAETRILLVPSRQEAFGRVALEAMVCGIPVLLSNAPGLSDATYGLAEAYIDQADEVAPWARHINRLLREPLLEQRSRVLQRASAFDVQKDVDDFVRACLI